MATTTPTTTRRRRSSFFFWYSLLLLAVLVVGFGPTFFFRPFFHETSLPAVVNLHGLIATLWFVAMVVQSALVLRGRSAVHRKLGTAGVIVALLGALTGVVTAFGVYPREAQARAERGVEVDADFLSGPGRRGQVVRDSVGFVTFLGLAAGAVAQRRRPDWHKRLMVLASIMLLTAALGRIRNWPAWSDLSPVTLTFGGVGLLLLIPMAHERWAEGRFHPAYLIGGPGLLGVVGLLGAIPMFFR